MMPSEMSPMLLSAVSEASASWPRIFVFLASMPRFASGRGLGAARNPDVDRVRILVLGGLDEGREIRVRYREADGTHDRAAVVLKALLEPSLGIDAWAVIRHHRVNRLDAVFARPLAKRVIQLRGGRRGPCDVRRLLSDD